MIERIPSRVFAPSASLLRTFARLNGNHPARALITNPQASRFLNQRRYASDLPVHTQNSLPNHGTGVIPPQPGFSSHSEPSPPSTPEKRKAPSLRPFIWAFLGIAIGLSFGNLAAQTLDPGEVPVPSSTEDIEKCNLIKQQGDQLPLVKRLTSDPEWQSWDAYNGFDKDRAELSLTAGSLQGSKAIGAYQKAFWNKTTGEVVSVIYLGPDVSGWPGIVHGGFLASILDESLARCSMLPRKSRVFTARLNIDYRQEVGSNSWYIIRASPIEKGSTDKKAFIKGTIEHYYTGKVCVEADGLFIIPKHMVEQLRFDAAGKW